MSKNPEISPKNNCLLICEKCDYSTSSKKDYNKHLTTMKHKRRNLGINEQIPDGEKSQISPQFCCSICEYKTISRKDFLKHENSVKHIKYTNLAKDNGSATNCNVCNKMFLNVVELWKHKQRNHNVKTKNAITTEMFMEFMKNSQELQNVLLEQNNKLFELANKQTITNTNSNNTTNNNNQFNLQFFLNETCKDALNITDFINSLQLKVSDFETTGRLGYVEGISRIILNGIKDMDISKRPVHCTDLKRETVYIKHENEWEKENSDKKKLKWAINSVAQMNLKQLPNWQLENPECINMDTRQNEELIKYSLAALGGQYKEEEDKYMDKIMKNVLKEVVVDKNI